MYFIRSHQEVYLYVNVSKVSSKKREDDTSRSQAPAWEREKRDNMFLKMEF